jgi:hypothetical protein
MDMWPNLNPNCPPQVSELTGALAADFIVATPYLLLEALGAPPLNRLVAPSTVINYPFYEGPTELGLDQDMPEVEPLGGATEVHNEVGSIDLPVASPRWAFDAIYGFYELPPEPIMGAVQDIYTVQPSPDRMPAFEMETPSFPFALIGALMDTSNVAINEAPDFPVMDTYICDTVGFDAVGIQDSFTGYGIGSDGAYNSSVPAIAV